MRHLHRFCGTKTFRNVVKNGVPPEIDCALRTRPHVQSGLEPFLADVAITFAFNRLPSAVDPTALFDRVLSTWRVNIDVTPVCRTGAVKRSPISYAGRDHRRS